MTPDSKTRKGANPADTLWQFSTGLADAIERATPLLVQVQARRWRPSSGTVYGPNLVLTADHTLEHDDDVVVRAADGRARAAEIVGRDPATDLALLRVESVAGQTIEPSDEIKVGHLVVALARTWSNRVAAAAGIVSVVGGPVRAAHGRTLEEIIRLDAVPHPAFSGGPVIDARGRLVGIGTAGLIRNGAAAVPLSVVRRVAAALIEHGHIRRGYLGINTQPVRIPDAQRGTDGSDRGLLVAGLAAEGPAAAAGVLVGDILVAFAENAVREPDELLALLTAERIGHPVRLTVVRGAERRSIEVTVGDRHTES
jgi:S1-C subfamily serine protease